MTLALFVIGIVVLPLSIWAAAMNSRIARAEPPVCWRYAWRARWLVGLMLGVASIFMAYPVDGADGQQYKVCGVPFPACAFDGQGADYVGLLTLPMFVLNAVIWIFILHLPLLVWGRLHGRNEGREAQRSTSRE